MLPSSFWRYSTTVLTPFASGPVICGAGAGFGRGEGQPAAIAAVARAAKSFSRRRWRSRRTRGQDRDRAPAAGAEPSRSRRRHPVRRSRPSASSPPSSRWLPLRRLRGCASERERAAWRAAPVLQSRGSVRNPRIQVRAPAAGGPEKWTPFLRARRCRVLSRVGTPSTRAGRRDGDSVHEGRVRGGGTGTASNAIRRARRFRAETPSSRVASTHGGQGVRR